VQSTIKAADGSRPGCLCSNSDVKEYNMYGDEDLFLHEAVGHHFQISLQENTYLIENTIGLLMKAGLYDKFRKKLGLYPRPLPILWDARKRNAQSRSISG
jgi:hypothetical protein